MARRHASTRVDYGLRLYHEVFKLDALHFGFWEPDDPRTLEGLRTAQARYTDHLLGKIPRQVHRVLDVGCGSGATSAQLQARGFEVEGLTPDAYQVEVFRQRRGHDIPLHQLPFEEFTPDQPFDLVIMSESAQYVPPALLFDAARRALRPGGHLLISDYFRRAPTAFYRTCHVISPFLEEAKRAGFLLRSQEEITSWVLPTLELGLQVYREYARPILEIAAGFLSQRAPLLSGAVSLLLRRRLAKLRWYLYDKSEEKLDAERFEREMVYTILHFVDPAER